MTDWALQDPAGQPVEVVRRIRDDIDARVQQLLAELVPASAWAAGWPPSLIVRWRRAECRPGRGC